MNFNRRYIDFSSGGLVNAVTIGAVPTGLRWRLIALFGHNNKGASQFLQIHNAVSAPADGAVPVIPFIINANLNFFIDLNDYGLRLTTGLYICNSSTLATKTIGSADCWINGCYEAD